ncbi:MAG: AI-2E family transporter [Vulcanimicrobiaceae bacterium]
MPERSTASHGALSNAAAIAAVAAAVVAATVAICFTLVKAQGVVLAFFGAVVVAEAARPLVDRLSARIPRPLALATTFATIAAAIGLAWIIPVRALAPQAIALWRSLPGFLADVAAVLQQFLSGGKPPTGGFEWLVPMLGTSLVSFTRGLLDADAGIAAFISTLVLVLLLALFWLGSSDALRGFVLTLVRPSERDGADALFREMGGKLGLYVSGTLINGTIVALASMILLSWLRAPYPIVLGLVQGLLVAIPYLGTLIAVLTVGAVVLTAQGWTKAAEAVLLISLMEGFEGSFISPLIFKKGLDVDPLSTILATAIGGALFGINGVVLAVPAAAVLQTIAVRLLAPAIRSFQES